MKEVEGSKSRPFIGYPPSVIVRLLNRLWNAFCHKVKLLLSSEGLGVRIMLQEPDASSASDLKTPLVVDTIYPYYMFFVTIPWSF